MGKNAKKRKLIRQFKENTEELEEVKGMEKGLYPPFKSLIQQIGCKFEENQICYMVIGSVAAWNYFEGRRPKDIDFGIRGFDNYLSVILTLAEEMDFSYHSGVAGFPDSNQGLIFAIREFLKIGGNPNRLQELQNATTVIKMVGHPGEPTVDLSCFWRPLKGRAMQRRRKIDGVWLCSPEDLIILKSISDRDKDREDIQIMLKRATEISFPLDVSLIEAEAPGAMKVKGSVVR
jgi:hypothetical protein